MSLANQILAALGLGVAAGIVVGEPMGALKVGGDVFVRLLQMTVLPYVVVSLVGGLGRLNLDEARRLAAFAGGCLLVIWTIAFALVVLMPLTFPTTESASFYSTALVAPRADFDFVGLYVTSNPFHALANNVVPAVVVFSLAVGAALMGIEHKQLLLEWLKMVENALFRVNAFIVRLTPLGVFAIGASAAGTMRVRDLEHFGVYVVSYVAFSLLATFWLLPGLLSALTPMRGGDLWKTTRGAMITAFATGSSFVVIPMLVEGGKRLLAQRLPEREESNALVNVLVPACHTFPHAAKVLTLSFIAFTGWASGSPLSLDQYPRLAASGIVSTFGSVNAAIPFLLDLMRLPHDFFQLFTATSVINARFGTLLEATHVVVLTLLGTCGATGLLRLRWRGILRYAVFSALALAGCVVGCRLLFAALIDTTYREAEIVRNMSHREDLVAAVVHREPVPAPALDPDRTRLEIIQERKLLRVCYRTPGSTPFAYFNNAEELVGLDIDMAHSLARGLAVRLEFVPIERSQEPRRIASALDGGLCDIVMSRSAVTMSALGEIAYSRPYLDLNLGFLVRDHRRQEFGDRERLEARTDLRIAVPDDRYYLDRVRHFLPQAEIVPVANARAFLSDLEQGLDALVASAETAAFWSLLFPQYTAVVPDPPLQKIPYAYPLPLGEPEWRGAVDSWLDLKQSDGTIDRLYAYWILGEEAEATAPRWSVLRDVLHWVD